MYVVSEEGGNYLVEFPIVELKEGDIYEEKVSMKVDRNGKPLEPGRFATLDQAVSAAAGSLFALADRIEAMLDGLEYALESDRRVEPTEIYDLSYLVHSLYGHASSLRSLSLQLKALGLIRPRAFEAAKAAFRRASALRRSLFDLRLLYLSQIQNSINTSMRRMTLVGTIALPAILISSIYGMNLSHLPLADHPLAVFALMALATAVFALITYKM